MDLFNLERTGPEINLLPYDGTAQYYGPVMKRPEADRYLRALLANIEWRPDEAMIFGRHIVTKRSVAWYADLAFDYTYSGTTKRALPWTAELMELRELTERLTGVSYNSCLLNLYHDGHEGMAWHSDDEKSLGKDTAIASLSFGAERKFALKHKESKEKVALLLESGSLFVMKGTTQTHWLHALPKMARVQKPRVNLTFRTMIEHL